MATAKEHNRESTQEYDLLRNSVDISTDSSCYVDILGL